MSSKTTPISRDLNDYSEQYLGPRYKFEKQMAVIHRRVAIEEMRKFPHRRILEIGCGMNPIFTEVDDFERMTLLEPAAVFFNNAEKLQTELAARSPAGAAKIEIINDTLENTAEKWRGDKFDFVFFVNLLHEMPDADTAMLALRRLLPAGAVAHVSVPNARSFHRLLALEAGLISSPYEKSSLQKLMQQSRIFDSASLRKIVTKHGFSIINEWTSFIKPFTHEQMASLEEDGFLTPELLNGLVKMTKYIPDLGAEIHMNIRIDGG